jgi:acetyl-CoA carboxylase carboxyl transferase subunit beta
MSENAQNPWFKRKLKGIITPSREKKETPDGFWYKTPSGDVIEKTELKENIFVTPKEGYHVRIGSKEYFDIIFDDQKFNLIADDLIPKDKLNFTDKKRYVDRIKDSKKKTGLDDAMRAAYGETSGEPIVVACMDFSFIGGSMGNVMGEKIARSIDVAIEKKCPFILISKSGGARMMEAGISLMQMAKATAKLTQLAHEKLLYISYLTDPTTGGVTASFAMLGDVNVAEPGALIGFAGPRVIKETIGKDLPEGFQTSEFLLEKGFFRFHNR